MPACEPLLARRIVATPAALDSALWPSGAVLRIAADEVLLIGASQSDGQGAGDITLTDEYAIVESDTGWAGAVLDASELADLARHHIEWPLPARPALAQGQIAGIPAKLHLPDGSDGALLICLAAVAHELEERLS